MGKEEECGNRKSDVVPLGKKLKLHLLIYIIDNTKFLKKKKKTIFITK